MTMQRADLCPVNLVQIEAQHLQRCRGVEFPEHREGLAGVRRVKHVDFARKLHHEDAARVLCPVNLVQVEAQFLQRGRGVNFEAEHREGLAGDAHVRGVGHDARVREGQPGVREDVGAGAVEGDEEQVEVRRPAAEGSDPGGDGESLAAAPSNTDLVPRVRPGSGCARSSSQSRSRTIGIYGHDHISRLLFLRRGR